MEPGDDATDGPAPATDSLHLHVAGDGGLFGLTESGWAMLPLEHFRQAVVPGATVRLSGGRRSEVDELLAARRCRIAEPTVETPDEATWPSVVLAAGSGGIRQVADLLERGADPSAPTASGATALHVAAHGGHLDVVELLLAAGADPTAVEDSGFDPLTAAAIAGHGRVVDALVRAGASPRVVAGADLRCWAALAGHHQLAARLPAVPGVASATTTDATGRIDGVRFTLRPSPHAYVGPVVLAAMLALWVAAARAVFLQGGVAVAMGLVALAVIALVARGDFLKSGPGRHVSVTDSGLTCSWRSGAPLEVPWSHVLGVAGRQGFYKQGVAELTVVVPQSHKPPRLALKALTRDRWGFLPAAGDTRPMVWHVGVVDRRACTPALAHALASTARRHGRPVATELAAFDLGSRQ